MWIETQKLKNKVVKTQRPKKCITHLFNLQMDKFEALPFASRTFSLTIWQINVQLEYCSLWKRTSTNIIVSIL
jgi:hypothetical protein